MKVTFADASAEFRPWKPAQGRSLKGLFAFDTETALIDEERPWLTPPYVLGAAFDGNVGVFVAREHAAAFFDSHRGLPVVMHNAPFDLAVLNVLAPQLKIYDWVEQNLVWDTQLLHRLLTLGTEGHTSSGKGQSSLESCAARYLGVDLPKDLLDAAGDDVRLSYGKWLNRRQAEIESVYLEYLAKDVIATRRLYDQLSHRLDRLLTTCGDVWGFVSRAWQAAQVKRWGPQTHHIQLKAAIVLKEISANGLHLDLERRRQIVQQLATVTDELRGRLRDLGYMPGKGSDKALQEILRRLERQHPGAAFPRTATGKFAANREALEDLADLEPFIRDLLDYKAVEKLRASFFDKMARPCIHPSFNSLLVTGRTSSFGELNAQNLPRDDRVRSCFVPSPGKVIIAADYAGLELATLAQSVRRQLGIPSKMADAINEGKDLHRLVASHVTGKPVSEVSGEERQKAKPINFGKPGGMGNDGLKRYAKASYGVVLNDDDVDAITKTWFDLFPEMLDFLEGGRVWGEPAARFFALTPTSYFEHTGSRKYLDHPDNRGRENEPHPILGSMCLKVLAEQKPCKGSGAAYTPVETDYFWAMVEPKIQLLPTQIHNAIRSRQASPSLKHAISRVADRSSCMTLTGRIRANASYCAQHNTMFQGLAADGAKLALWRLWRAGYRVVNFVHDEALVEVPADADLRHHAEAIRAIMIAAMHEVVPDVRIDVEFAAMDRWQKEAKEVTGPGGSLEVWRPPAKLTTDPSADLVNTAV